MSKNKKSLVALAKEPTIQESVTKVFELMGGVSNLIEKGSSVVLKPNAGHAAPPESAVCTNPEVLRAVIREVKKAQPGKIVIAEAAAVGCDTMECYKISGIQAVAEEEGIELIDIKREKDLINVAVRGYHSNINRVKLPRFLLEADHIINVPILKAHASMVFSCALKNIKGVVQDSVHMLMHRENLTMAMMDVWSAVRADINIVDAIYAAGGFSPHTPVPLKVGCIIGSKDPVAVDRISCDLVGIDTDKVDYFRVADEVGMGNSQLDGIELVGEKVEDCFTKMWVPYVGDMSTRWPEYDIHCEGACSSCQALLALSMETLKAIGEYDHRSDTTLIVGGKNEIPEGVDDSKLVLQGNCTRKYLKDHPNALWVKGCPPGEACVYVTIAERKLYDAQTDESVAHLRECMAKDQPVWKEYVMQQAEKFYGDLNDNHAE